MRGHVGKQDCSFIKLLHGSLPRFSLWKTSTLEEACAEQLGKIYQNHKSTQSAKSSEILVLGIYPKATWANTPND